MDGISTVASIFIILNALIVIFFLDSIPNIQFILLIGVLASLCGFLIYNWHPSKMYMGDTGSQFLGILLASIAINYFWDFRNPGHDISQSKQIIITLLAFLIPICDTTTVTINRLAKGKSPFVGGKDHTTHHLSYLGLLDWQIAVLFTVISLISMFFVYLIIFQISIWKPAYTFLFGGYAIIIFLFLYTNTLVSKPSLKIKRGRQLIHEKNGNGHCLSVE